MSRCQYLVPFTLLAACGVVEPIADSEPDAGANQNPEIALLEVSGGSPGEPVEVSCDAADPDGDELLVELEVSHGELAGDGPTATWQLPDREVAAAVVSCTAGDGRGGEVTASEEIAVEVTRDLVLHYPFAGTTENAAASDMRGSLAPGAAFVADRAGRPGAALRIPRIDAAPPLSAFDSDSRLVTDQLTVSAWLELDGLDPVDRAILEIRDPFGGPPLVELRVGPGDELVYRHADGATTSFAAPPSPPLPRQRFVHVAVAVGGGQAVTYIDGNAVQFSSATTPQLAETGPIAVGPIQSQVSLGVIDDLRFYDRALTAAEVAAIASGDI